MSDKEKFEEEHSVILFRIKLQFGLSIKYGVLALKTAESLILTFLLPVPYCLETQYLP